MSGTEAPASRRARLRAATVEEIKAVALRLLVEQGPEAVTLRAIAREMGMTAPGLYRYFPSHDSLHRALVADTYDRLTAALVAARDGAVDAPPPEDLLLAGKPPAVVQLVVAARAFRAWAVGHPQEFALVFGTPVPAWANEDNDPAHQAGMRFGAVFTEIFLRLWADQPFPVPDDETLPTTLADQLRGYRDQIALISGEATSGEAPPGMPLAAIETFLRAWVQLYGLVAMEVFRHLHFCMDDVSEFFDRQLHEIGRTLGIEAATSGPEPTA